MDGGTILHPDVVLVISSVQRIPQSGKPKYALIRETPLPP
jgi:hypothetical protein